MNNNYYRSPLSPEELREQLSAQRLDQARNDNPLNAPNQGSVTSQDVTMTGGDSLDEIIRQNTNELHRRRSMPQPFSDSTLQDDQDRRMTMIDFGSPNDSYTDFQFANMSTPGDGMGGAFGNIAGTMAMPGHSGPYSQANLMAMAHHGDYSTLSPDVMGNMMAFSNLNMDSMTTDPAALGLYSPAVGNHFGPSPLDSVNPDFDMDLTNVDNGPMSASGAGATVGSGLKSDEDMMRAEQNFGEGETSNTPQARPSLGIDPTLASFQPNLGPAQTANYRSPSSGTSRTLSQISVSQVSAPTPITANTPATSTPAPSMNLVKQEKDKTIYSKSGFDMLRALWYVATRKNPTIQLGAVDMSCAFVVCDVTQNDCPIIYVSENFQNLTGYSRHEIAGKNCRFLQSPTGLVEAGSRREFVENDAVFKLKNCIARGEEIQQSLINYRKGGKPFLNLLTMVPIPWDDPEEIRFFIGFQIDLVECPDAITGTEGGVRVDYQHNEIGPYIWTPPPASQWEPENGQTLGIDDVSALLKQYTPNGAASDWHKQSWDKMLLENADDVIHVLSLKGLFLYLSPSCKKVLEYDSSELMGSALSEICHPSDLVPAMRELKETQGDNVVNIVFRIRRKHSGYMWFESHGSLFAEQGKGRKCIILVGRHRPVYGLRRRDLELNGGIGDNEIWTKVSTSGMFLFVSSAVRSLLDIMPNELVGKSMQELMRKESRAEFGRTIEKARKGKIVGCKHEVQHKRGQVLQAYTTFYPAEQVEGQKPAYLLAQTKLHKASSRTISPTSPTGAGIPRTPNPLSPSDDPATGSYVGERAMTENGPLLSPTGITAQELAQQARLVADDNMFDELKTTRCTSWQYELRQMEKMNRLLAEQLGKLLSSRKKRKRRKGGNMVRDCVNCHTRNTPEWRRGPSGNRDLCNSCGLRWAKSVGRVSPRNSARSGNGDAQSRKSNSPNHTPSHASPLHRDLSKDAASLDPVSRSSATATPGSTNEGSPGGQTPMIGPPGANMTTPSGGKINMGGHMNPPPSQPLLAGGSGHGGGGMEMTLIREEREASA